MFGDLLLVHSSWKTTLSKLLTAEYSWQFTRGELQRLADQFLQATFSELFLAGHLWQAVFSQPLVAVYL